MNIDPRNAVKKVDRIEALLREFYRGSDLNLSGQSLTDIEDDRIYNLRNVSLMDVSDNKIQVIPD